jgi:transcriptional regulator with XRE-family HTH domain
MRDKSTLISKLKANKKTRAAYIKAKIGTLVPAQIRALRVRSDMPRQEDLAKEADMQQSRISMLESPGAANVTLETLAWLASVFNVGLVVKFVPFSEMLKWENTFSQDDFDVVPRLDKDVAFSQGSALAEMPYSASTAVTMAGPDWLIPSSGGLYSTPPAIGTAAPKLAGLGVGAELKS